MARNKLIDWLECFFVIECHVALDRYSGPWYDTLLLRFQTTFKVHVPIDSFTHYPAFYTVGLHSQTPTRTPASQEVGSLFNFYDGLWYDANPRPTSWEADTLTYMFWYQKTGTHNANVKSKDKKPENKKFNMYIILNRRIYLSRSFVYYVQKHW